MLMQNDLQSMQIDVHAFEKKKRLFKCSSRVGYFDLGQFFILVALK